LLVWDKDSYTEIFLAFLPCTQIGSSLPDLFTTSQSKSICFILAINRFWF
jgi:hypothetical protein